MRIIYATKGYAKYVCVYINIQYTCCVNHSNKLYCSQEIQLTVSWEVFLNNFDQMMVLELYLHKYIQNLNYNAKIRNSVVLTIKRTIKKKRTIKRTYL